MNDIWCREERRFLTFLEYKDKYSESMTWLNYQGLHEAISIRWKNILQNNVRMNENFEHTFDSLTAVKGSRTKTIYHQLTSNCLNMVDSFNRWQNVMDQNISLSEYEKRFSNLYRITNNTKLRNFQFCLLHKKIPTNKEILNGK